MWHSREDGLHDPCWWYEIELEDLDQQLDLWANKDQSAGKNVWITLGNVSSLDIRRFLPFYDEHERIFAGFVDCHPVRTTYYVRDHEEEKEDFDVFPVRK